MACRKQFAELVSRKSFGLTQQLLDFFRIRQILGLGNIYNLFESFRKFAFDDFKYSSFFEVGRDKKSALAHAA